jgi:PKD repeat protein
MNILFSIFLFLISLQITAQSIEWTKTIGGVGNDYGHSINVDNNGNIYTTGYFEGTVDFDPDTGVYNLTTVYIDIFIQKIDASGNFVWAKSIGNTSFDPNYTVSTSIDDSGNIYTTGSFSGSADFDPGVGVSSLSAVGGFDVFIQKLDSAGNFIWSKSIGGSDDENGYSISVDASGNLYTVGQFTGTCDFDPGSGVTNLTSLGGLDFFVQKMDASGNFLWAKRIGDATDQYAYSINIDNTGSIYVTGGFNGIVDFDPGIGTTNLTSAGGYDVFVLKMDFAGNFIWVKSIGGLNGDYSRSSCLDNYGNIYTSGRFHGTADFNSDTGVVNLTSAGNSDVFIQKMDASGNFIWARSIGGSLTDDSYKIASDTLGFIYTIGHYNSTADFNPDIGVYNLTSAGLDDIFVHKMDSSGNFIWVNSIGGTSAEFGRSVSVNKNGDLYTTGYFVGTADFNPDAGTNYITSTGGNDVFIQKINPCTPSTGTDTQYVCNSLTWIDGNTYTTSTNTPTFNIIGGASSGCDSIVNLNLTINNPISSFGVLNNGNGNYTFTNISSGNFNQSHWAFGDGTTSTQNNPNHTFNANGTYVVVLTINDSTVGSSCIDYYLDTIIVTGVPISSQCVAGFVMYPDTGNVTVINSSTGNNLTYLWDFGDSNTSSLQFPSHTYTLGGSYYLCLTIDDGAGCLDTYCDSIGESGVIFNKQTGFTINVIGLPLPTSNNQDILTSGITIYPNPSSNKIILKVNNQLVGSSYIFCDSMGKIVLKGQINTESTVIELGNLSGGIYLFSIGENKQSFKIIKD